MVQIKESLGQQIEEPDIDAPISNSTALQGPEQCQVELSGYKVSLGSCKFFADFLCDLSLHLIKELKGLNNKDGGGNYLG